ncbi:MAG TPA: hypothetical protein RMF84_12190 [Polyangiaceae bacterium LLY-WYZ-14_1]|nr:hypothetical protein [Polyangiaceae bacterium LLY-WYZ-14_1]
MARPACALALAISIGLAGAGAGALRPPPSSAQGFDDPFAGLAAVREQVPVRVPPRALAVIPERHLGRRLLLVDELDGFEPQFDDVARGLGLSLTNAIQLRTKEARLPVFVPKTEETIATLLQVPVGTRLGLTGLVVTRAGRYLFLASDVRPASRSRRRRR